jgi:hypothetical membrane protein
MTHKYYGILGMFIPILFWTTYITLAMARPEYSFLTKAISELGSLDAPNLWMWNVAGYIIPGLLIVIYSYGLFQKMATNRLPMVAFMLSGVLMALSGIFPGDFENRTSITMLLHTIGSFGSYVCFLIAAFTSSNQMRKSEYWKKTIKPTLFFTYATILFGAWPFIFPNMPGVGQRLVFLFYLLWIFYTALMLYKQKAKEKLTVTS